MELSEMINLALGGGLMATVVALFTMRSTIKEANAKAAKAMAEAETVRIDNTEHATRILIENIVEPLKQELDETRHAMQLTKREMSKLRKAIDTANSCKHSGDCPVLAGVRKQQEGARDQDGADAGADRPLQGTDAWAGGAPCEARTRSARNGGDGTARGQPP